MVGLDSLYAMLARPIPAVIKRKRVVEETEYIKGIAADSHEAPQSQLPPNLERRHAIEDRRGSPRGDRRGQTEKEEERKKELAKAQQEAIESPLPHIDIDV
ncbi:hypothetical protein [Shewanella atlantica]|uniref:Uncharacterized protein n=1 Tax=Shewanella atlantica TaxID=271099 RepID=A0A3S0KEX3_9GAMM|nr:hypothetical protein [Shewanella atlantica]RTR29255.1 hypothetical protein EKG39_17230 [Shewanella atlantica]